MKISILSVFCTALMACGGSVVNFDVDQKIPEQRVAGTVNPLAGLLPGFLPEQKITINLKQETEKRGTGPATSAHLKQLLFSITQNSGNFDFLDNVHLFIAAPTASLPKQEIATLSSVAKGSTTVNFVTNSSFNLLPYVNAGAELTATATGTPPTKDVTFDGMLVLNIGI